MANQPKSQPPHGMEPYDLGSEKDLLGALSDEQQQKLNKFKMSTRTENEKYLRQHPEVHCLLSGFLGDILKKRPGNVREFAATYFTDPKLPITLQKQLEERQQNIRTNRVLKRI